jgi:endonuclease YncB( thermonuclease family)
MKIIRFDPKRRQNRSHQQPRDILTPALALAALVSVCTLAWVVAGTLLPSGTQALVASELRAQFRMCGSGQRHTCVVDGDTIWFEGTNLRLQAYDTPEPYNDICGGAQEVALAKRASARLLELLNSNGFTVDTFGTDRYGRTLAIIRIGGTDVGDILISEGLARRWPDGPEFWC